ncbi:low temperature requirement protein A [Frankia sp. CNm7]|uniref:Low temperature requirement protein A n=1 Tax=Frankia nepalensis TaxID=1836974 RepID=A0A937RMI8_9ACTN|nr:low temperature requirement protein A [Frankia nepalensis]MBL7500751.1 low temperature requirement protein A [Frankia nepalensis]MBL7511761.1 low temperature requirement protein A [Frankia nepalensis]MBL7524328.1 low temperature requirement protein A [Frankia nepalensis]MBL7633177.1 low temperature requirement protein A [Frankia nepalensis]
MENLRHRALRMSGRDPGEAHRAATTLELLFDLAFVVAFGTAANELAHALAAGHVGAGISGFVFATFAVSWAWINFTWFASAYDTDDWRYRLTTMLQMVGVLVLALGLPAMFASLDHGETLDNDVMVWGYVVMRIAMVLQWWRASRQDPGRRAAHTGYIVSIVVSQIIWVALALLDFSVGVSFALLAIPLLIELGGPIVAERRFGGTPWHPHHIAERHGLMVIIALGEGLIGTMASLTALTGEGLTMDVALLALAGTAMTFGMWWTYFVIPHGEILRARRNRSFGWGYGHLPLFGAIVAVGAGLHAAAYFLDHHSELSLVGTVMTVVAPLAFYVLALYVFYAAVSRSLDPFHLLLVLSSVGFLVAPVVMAAAGVSVTWCLLVLALTPWVTVLGYETVGYRHNTAVLEALRS